MDWIDKHYEEGFLYVSIQFMDGTYLSLQFSPSIVTEGIEFFSDTSSGDDEIIETYYRRREDC